MSLSIYSIIPILTSWVEGQKPTDKELRYLLAEELKIANPSVFGITAENGLEKIETRSNLFLSVYSDILDLCQKFGLNQSPQILSTLWNFWLPLAINLAKLRQKLGRTAIQGILGGQGTGKTTASAIIRLILDRLGYSTLALSLDDLYKTYAERQKLQQEDPRLIWRGPPGTHDVRLGIDILDKLRQNARQEEILVPRFDKSACNGAGDRSKFERVEKVDLVLFEGWFVGVRPIAESAFDNAPDPIKTEADRSFAKDINQKLKDYLPLWQRLDNLIVFYPVDYRLSKQWRKEAERKMIATGKSGMSDREIEEFVEYFWRSLHPELFITPLIKNPNLVDLVIEINGDRSLNKIDRPTKKLS
jgi:D-glycerate 3-kinase